MLDIRTQTMTSCISTRDSMRQKEMKAKSAAGTAAATQRKQTNKRLLRDTADYQTDELRTHRGLTHNDVILSSEAAHEPQM